MSKTSLQRATLVAAATTLLAAATADAASAPYCDTVQFAGSTQQFAPDTPFVGEMTMTDLLTGESRSASVVTMLLGSVSADGSRVVTSHEISGEGEPGVGLVTFDDAQLIPLGPGVFTLISHMKVKSGKGAYNCGELVIGAGSTLSFDLEGLGTADYSGFGRLCRCKPSDN